MKEDDHQARTSPNLTELQSIHDLLKDATLNKLSDRDVMIPITTKAFVEGRLMPTTTVMKNDAQEKEQVIVKLGKEYLAEMSLDDACSYIERRMKDLRPLVKDSISSTTKPKAEFKMKKGFLNDKSKSRTQKKQEEEKNSREKIPISRNDEPILPFMDIVEEYDESGNQVKAEALDVSKQLIDFQRKIKGQYQHDETKESFNEPVELSTDLDDDSLEQDNNESNEYVPTKTQSYEAISARLDELALLEAEEETKKQQNVKSSRKLQGKGWTKGFLSGNRSKTSHDRSKNAQSRKVNVPSDAKQMPSTDASWNSTDNKGVQDDRERKVQFSGDNQVKEIPRIGTKSIQDVMGPPRQSQESRKIITPQDLDQIMMRNVVMSPSTDNIGPSKETKPVSMGGVVERQNVTSEMNSTSEDKQPKKLSRFAQRRQQMR